MDKLTQIRTFVRVAERASFSAVACDMAVTQSAVSKAISALETDLGVRLVSRSTRNVALTDAGRRYYEQCRRVLVDLDEAEASVRDAQSSIGGSLKVAAPVPFGLMFISPRVIRFKAMHPLLSINLDLCDQPTNLVEQNVDVAIRLGHLKTAGLVARKLGESPFLVVASPAYLSGRGIPSRPQDLSGHNCLVYANEDSPQQWTFSGNRDSSSVSVASNYRSNSLLALKDAAMAGVGITRLPLWMVDHELKSGVLRQILTEARMHPYAIHAVFPSARQIPVKVSAFVEFMRHELGGISYFLREK